MSRLTNSWHRITEQITTFVDAIIPEWSFTPLSGLRSGFQILATRFWGSQPAYDNTIVNYDHCRPLYRNDGDTSNLGAGFCKPIIDLTVDFIGVPTASTDDETTTDFLNKCLHDYWGSEIKQVFRNSMRDSKTIMRLRLPDINNPLVSMEERTYGVLETVDPERVAIQYRPGNKEIIDVAYITRRVLMIQQPGDVISGMFPQEREHLIIEVITPENFRYFDKTENRWMTEFDQDNAFGVVPLVEVWNEYDSSLSGGQSDLESVYPFVMALHDCMAQSLQAHKYHSTPKIKFKLHEVASFVRNNFPEAWDETTGRLLPNSSISWDSKSVVFLQVDEEADFIEAKSVLNDSRELMEFLIDCISVASETPRWAFMLIEPGSANQANNAQTLPFIKKVERKRIQFAKSLQKILKLIEYYNGMSIQCPTITWDTSHPEQLATWAQAFQFFVMSLEVMAQRQIISDQTYREIVSQYLPQMENPAQEALDAKKNFDALAAQTQPPTNSPPSGNRSSNGSGDKKSVPPVISGKPQGKNE